MRDFPTGLPPKSVQQPTALRGGPFQKPALINLVNSSRLQVEVCATSGFVDDAHL